MHHLGERLARRARRRHRATACAIRYSVEHTLLDTGGGIRFAAPLLAEAVPAGVDDPADSPIVVLNGDVVSEIPIRDVVRFHRERDALATLRPARRPAQAAAYGLFGFDGDGRIRRFLGKGDADPSLRELHVRVACRCSTRACSS